MRGPLFAEDNRGAKLVRSVILVLLALSLALAGRADSALAAQRKNTKKQETPATQTQAATADTSTTSDATEEQDLIAAAQAMRRSGLVQFNFKDMELVKFVRFMSELLGENIIVPPNITAKITIISPKPSTLNEARQIMISTLQMYNFSLQNMGAYSIVRQGGNSPSPDVTRGRVGPGPGEETVTYIVPLDYVTVDSVIPAIQHSFSQNVIVLPVGNGRDILLQGRAVDVTKAVNLLRKMDTPQSARVSRTFEIRYGDPTTIASQLNAVAQTGGPLQGLSAIADATSRKVIVVGTNNAIRHASNLLKDLDVDSKIGDFHVYKLKNIDANTASEQISKVLSAAASLQSTNQDAKFPATVVPDLTTNSLIFAATQKQYESLCRVLDEIDVQPRQVLLRGFIAEINVSNLDRNGIDWSILGGKIWDGIMLGGMGTLGENSIPSEFVSMMNDLMKKQELVDRNGSTYSVTNYEPLALVYTTIEMLKKYDAVNVLSVPRLMCTDNKQSSFQVGQVIPVLKGSLSDLSNPGASQQSYDYKDTGLTLTVTPHIRSGNLVALDIKQTTEDLLTSTASVTPITAKREVNTSVIVGDGETIILGGMVKETERALRRRTPGLSYIPLIGSLFQKVSKEKEKVDFVIFLTPQIISTPEEMRGATQRAVGFTNALLPPESADLDFDSNLLPQNVRDSLNIQISPVEQDLDRRFQELYRRTLKQQR